MGQSQIQHPKSKNVSRLRLVLRLHSRSLARQLAWFFFLTGPVVLLASDSGGRVGAPNPSLPSTISKLPSNAEGVAAKYPGDRGIERDPRVLFAENFETGRIEELARRWDSMSNHERKVMAFSNDVPPSSSGRRSLQMTVTLAGYHPATPWPQGARGKVRAGMTVSRQA
jgi:hypothetical protein